MRTYTPRAKEAPAPPEPPKIDISISKTTPEPLARRILQDFSDLCAKKKFWRGTFDTPDGFTTLATSIYDTFGSNSEVWRLFTQVLCPVALPMVAWNLYQDKTISLSDLLKVMGPTNDIGDWELTRVLGVATSKAIVQQTRKLTSARRKLLDFSTREVGGVQIQIDRPQGFEQQGVDEQGNAWTRTYCCDYGYFPGTNGGDGEALDCYLGQVTTSPYVWFIEQHTSENTFDEWKVMLQFGSEKEAKETYLAHTPEKFFVAIYRFDLSALKELIATPPNKILDTVQPFRLETKSLKLSIKSFGEPQSHFVLGVVLAPEEFDLHNEIYGVDAIREAAHKYLEDYRQIGLQHSKIIVTGIEGCAEGCPATIVESYLSPVDWEMNGQKVPQGSWILGMKIYDPDLWGKISSGAITAFSMGGWVKGRPEVAPAIPVDNLPA